MGEQVGKGIRVIGLSEDGRWLVVGFLPRPNQLCQISSLLPSSFWVGGPRKLGVLTDFRCDLDDDRPPQRGGAIATFLLVRVITVRV